MNILTKVFSVSFIILSIFCVIYVTLFLDELSKAVFYFSSFYIEPSPYTEFFIGLITYFCFILLCAFVFKDYFNFWLIKGFITLYLLVFREASRPFDSATYYGFGVYDLEKYNLGLSGTSNVMYITHYMSYIFGNSYYSLKVAFSFLSFLGLILFYKSFIFIAEKNKMNIPYYYKYYIFLLPSILLWTSSIGKDAIIFFAFGLFTYSMIKIIDKFSVYYLVLVGISMITALFIRPWYPLIMSMALLLYFMKINSFKSVIMLLLFSFPFYLAFGAVMAKFGISDFDSIFERMTSLSMGFARGNAAIEVNEITGLGSYAYYFIPNSFTALFRPMLYESKNIQMLFSAIENTFLLYLFIRYFVLNIRLLYRNKFVKFLIVTLFAWLLLYVIPQGNLGTTVRFKVQILPILLIIVLYAKLCIENKRLN